MNGVCTIAAPPNVVFGQVCADTGSAIIRYGRNRTAAKNDEVDCHSKFGMMPMNGPLFRYLIEDGIVYWWTDQDDRTKACAEFVLEDFGHKVNGHRIMLRCDPEFQKAHGEDRAGFRSGN